MSVHRGNQGTRTRACNVCRSYSESLECKQNTDVQSSCQFGSTKRNTKTQFVVIHTTTSTSDLTCWIICVGGCLSSNIRC